MKSILPNLSQYKIVLGSNSPRRRELLAGLDIEFEVRTVPGIDESYPETLRLDEVPLYIARKKAEAYISSMPADELLITADTVVWASGEILGKPKDREDAVAMLRKLSGRTHEVITGVCITTKEKTVSFSASSSVVLPPWMRMRLPTMSTSTVLSIKPAVTAYRNGLAMWQSNPSTVVSITSWDCRSGCFTKS